MFRNITIGEQIEIEYETKNDSTKLSGILLEDKEDNIIIESIDGEVCLRKKNIVVVKKLKKSDNSTRISNQKIETKSFDENAVALKLEKDKYYELLIKSSVNYNFEFLQAINSEDKLKMIKKDIAKLYPKILNTIEKFMYAKKINEIESKFGRINVIVKELYEFYEKQTNADLVIDIISSILIYTEFTFEELIKTVPRKPIIYIANAIVLTEKAELAKAFHNLENYFSKERLIKENINLWHYFVLQTITIKQFGAYFFQVSFFDEIDTEIKNEIINAVKFICNSLNINIEKINICSKQDVNNLLNIIKEIHGSQIIKKNYEKIIPLFDSKIFEQKMYGMIEKSEYIQAEEFLNENLKEHKNESLENWTKKMEVIRNNKEKYSNLPKDNSHFSIAKRLEMICEDYSKAEYHYKISIEMKEPKFKSAIKEYINIVAKFDVEKAIEISNNYKGLFGYGSKVFGQMEKERISYSFFLLGIYGRSVNKSRIISMINEILSFVEKDKLKNEYKENIKELYYKRGNLYLELEKNVEKAIESFESAKKYGASEIACNRNIALCFMVKGNLEKAEEILNKNMHELGDSLSINILNRINDIRNNESKLENNFDLIEDLLKEKIDNKKRIISIYNDYYILKCQFEGLPVEKKNNKEFEENDIVSLKNSISKGKPKERSEYLRTAALIREELDGFQSNSYFEILSDSISILGNYYYLCGKRDSAKTCYLLSLLNNGNNKPALLCYLYALNGKDNKIQDLINKDYEETKTFYKSKFLIETEEYIIKFMESDNEIEEFVLLVNFSIEAFKIFKNVFDKNEKVRKKIFNKLCDKIETNNNDISFVYEKIDYYISENLKNIENNIDILKTKNIYQESSERFQKIKDNIIIFDKDKNFIGVLAEIYEKSKEIIEFSDYENRFNTILILKSKLTQLNFEVEETPTIFSIVFLKGLIASLIKQVEEEEDKIEENFKPKVDIEIPITDFSNKIGDKINIAVTLRNKENCASTKNVIVVICDIKEKKLSTEVNFGVIKGGKTAAKEINITAKEESFSIKVKVRFEVNNTEKIEEIEKQFQISLKNEEVFEKIKNPYKAGEPVTDSQMFFGRGNLLNELEETLINSTNNCIVLYGQKRTGKSSVFYHLKNRLKENFIIINFSIGSGVNSINSFYKTIQNKIIEYVEEKILDKEMLEYVEKTKVEDMTDFIRFLRKSSKLININKSKKLEYLLMIDEFTYLYRYIKENIIEKSFMDSWKAMLEENLFKVALIGQDTMPNFIKAFPNQFGIAKEKRISYLDKKSCEDLILNPIRTKGNKSIYLEESYQIIYELTSGQPYYTQMLCEKIVNFINEEQKIYITIATIEYVKEELLKEIGIDKFDNLIDSGDGSEENKKLVLKLLYSIARNGKYGDWTHISDVVNIENKNIFLETLKNRDVIEINGEKCRIVVKLFTEWLNRNYIEEV